MIFSKQGNFSEAQAITATAASDNVLDLRATGTPLGAPSALTRDIGKGNPIKIRVQVVTTFATLTSLVVAIQTDSVEAFSSPATVVASQAIAAASLVAGYVFVLEYLPRNVNERYLRLNYTVAGSNATAGAVTAGIVAGHDSAQ